MKFCLSTIMVKDMAESLKFYHDIIGLTPNQRFQAGPDMEIAFLGEGETQIELICDRNAQEEINIGEGISLGFEVEDLDKMLDFIKKEKIQIHSGPFQPNPNTRFFYILDPNGLKIQFVEQKK